VKPQNTTAVSKRNFVVLLSRKEVFMNADTKTKLLKKFAKHHLILSPCYIWGTRVVMSQECQEVTHKCNNYYSLETNHTVTKPGDMFRCVQWVVACQPPLLVPWKGVSPPVMQL
jgi:hypothetical protein